MSAGTTKDNTSLVVQSCRQGGQGRRCGDNNHGCLLQVMGLKQGGALSPSQAPIVRTWRRAVNLRVPT
jgi:hypothetical protein